MKLIHVALLGSAFAFASGTITPGAKKGGARCATSTVEGAISRIDVAQKSFSVTGPGNAVKHFKVAADTVFRIPGATPQELKDAPLSKVTANARVKVSYCSKDGTLVEVKVER